MCDSYSEWWVEDIEFRISIEADMHDWSGEVMHNGIVAGEFEVECDWWRYDLHSLAESEVVAGCLRLNVDYSWTD